MLLRAFTAAGLGALSALVLVSSVRALWRRSLRRCGEPPRIGTRRPVHRRSAPAARPRSRRCAALGLGSGRLILIGRLLTQQSLQKVPTSPFLTLSPTDLSQLTTLPSATPQTPAGTLSSRRSGWALSVERGAAPGAPRERTRHGAGQGGHEHLLDGLRHDAAAALLLLGQRDAAARPSRLAGGAGGHATALQHRGRHLAASDKVGHSVPVSRSPSQDLTPMRDTLAAALWSEAAGVRFP